MLTFSTPVENLTSVGKTTAARLKKIGIKTANDLLWNIPRGHDDLSQIVPIAKLETGHKITIKAKLESINTKKSPRKRMYITEAWVSDESGELKIIWFNQPYISKNLHPGDELYLAGEVLSSDFLKSQLTNPTYEKTAANPTHTARIVPLYHLTAGLTQKQIRFLIKQVLPLARTTTDWLPEEIIKKNQLINLPQALKSIHFPDSLKEFRRALNRLKFDELFFIMLAVELNKQKISVSQADKIIFKKELTKKYVASLPFELTKGQKKVAWEILGEISKNQPMNRLLEGDVGSGKTVVASLPILNAVAQKKQVVLIAPTEILARQHFQTFCELFSKQNITLALFTRTDKKIFTKAEQKISKKEILEKITSADIRFVIGTHAILQTGIIFSDLALIIIDEQHRFGVEQRQSLKNKTLKKIPHFLSMTATPIPRSLALTLYGDLNISLLKEKPLNRKPIITRLIKNNDRPSAYDFIRKEIKSGRQAFVICPLIEESDKLGVKAANREYEILKQNVFPDLNLGLVHGKLKKQEKERVMADFKNRKIDILIATAVVEVGVNIPNATIMIIEGADRFGLAQLHQFRGRVGRSELQSYCLLFTESQSPKTLSRLDALVKINDGFRLAEKDLKFRGPGDIYGYKQSGLPEMKVASLNDLEIIQKAKQAAGEIIKQDPTLDKYPKLKQKLADSKKIHFE